MRRTRDRMDRVRAERTAGVVNAGRAKRAEGRACRADVYHGPGAQGAPLAERVAVAAADLLLKSGSRKGARRRALNLASKHRDADAVRFYSEVAACLG